jgi:hypothetical protein
VVVPLAGVAHSQARDKAHKFTRSSEDKMGAPTVTPIVSKQGYAMWPAQKTSDEIMAVFDIFTETGFVFVGEITVIDAKYWLFRKTDPVVGS